MAGETFCENAMELTTTRSTNSPIKLIPPELLAQIFEHYTSERGAFSPVLLSQVSSLWRQTAITTPSLWHSISIRFPIHTPHITSARVRTWLARSGAFPLHISLLFTEWSDDVVSMSIFNNLRTHVHHWGRFSLTAPSVIIACRIFLVFFTEVNKHAMLSRLDVRAGPSFPFDLDDEEEMIPLEEVEDERGGITNVFAKLMAAYAPCFTEFNLAAPALPYASWRSKGRLEFPHLRKLRFFERPGRAVEISASSILHLLAKCPALEEFVFRGSDIFEPQGIITNIINLPHLRVLHLAQTCHQRVILSHLVTPALEVLKLSWLNRPEALIDEAYIPHPSEANEAPVEPSQSPYTDILTGAGMRLLIGRGAPPIRVLDMDFADARSPKDFLWIFERLPTLESFRIVGSDMSDKVLIALSCKGERRGWLCPRLTSLDFLRCDLITGYGVVRLAKSRNPCQDDMDWEAAKDVAADQPRPARLKRFVVEACARIECEDVAVVQHIVGDVDFEVGIVSP
jgi:hypothetical protein